MLINHRVTREIDFMTVTRLRKEITKSAHDQLLSYQMPPNRERTLKTHNRDCKKTINNLGKRSQLSVLMIVT